MKIIPVIISESDLVELKCAEDNKKPVEGIWHRKVLTKEEIIKNHPDLAALLVDGKKKE